ncbi:RagB/SusD family nutrient uptake outer membrane protein [Sphingobacterium sp. SRCM116780]|uniref:RagB/SusD family nutrient uptake outer membrane protein n=1 Tax=Sphingobacterium sp. SRCM116780 TaxID=2907623 RepID=UPI001F449D8D|nr:RagB/SusD family nutrient uptake outer membrane protein [Sphingobacterium sp. SRCM116780]UIR55280.1 RagB/SusD family nutrient uptake outer membrane protein [Sphingobacterium sp. SRCM116780]
MKIQYYIFILGVVLGYSSCKNELNLYPEDALSDPSFWKSEQDLELYASRFYDILPGANGPGADNQSDWYVSNSPNSYLFGYDVTPTSGGGWSSGDWENIRACNYFLRNYTRVKGSETRIAKSVALVRFFRAWEYFNKLKNFGDLPWLGTDLQVNADELFAPRTSREIVMDSIIADLDYAIAKLPEQNEVKVGELHRYAAMAFKSRICLFEGTYRKYRNMSGATALLQTSIAAAKQIMDSNNYAIWSTGQAGTDYTNLFLQEDLSKNTETILARTYVSELLMHNNTRQLEESGTGLSKAAVESYLCTDGRPISVSKLYQGDQLPTTELQNRDPRLLQTVDNPQLPFKNLADGSTQYRPLPMIDPQYCTTGYYVMKYHSPDPVQWNIGMSTLDVFIFRYAEVLLNYAEANAELGTCTQSVLDQSINKLRDRVAMAHLVESVGFQDANWPNYGYNLSPLLHEIRRERAVELVGEGFRWDDIVRWKGGKLIENPKTIQGLHVTTALAKQYPNFNKELSADGLLLVYPKLNVRKWNDKLYLRPLPIDQLTLNDKLNQNPGW